MTHAVALAPTMQRKAQRRLDDARLALDFANDAFVGFPSDVTREAIIEAATELEDAEAVYAEWSV